MLITCNCLNVSICAKDDNIRKIDVTSLGLTTSVQNDPFFKEELGTVDLVRISKEQPSLIRMRNIGSWIVHHCLNCSMDSYAINREKGASFVLVSCRMVTNPSEVSSYKNSVNYSSVYRIVVNSTDESSLVETKLSAPHMPSSIQAALSALQQQLHESLQREAQEVEERVRTFQDQQYAHLDEFRKRAHEDHRALAKLLFEKSQDEDNPILGANLRTPPALVEGNEAPSLPPPPEFKRDWLNDTKADSSSDMFCDSMLLEPRNSPVKAAKRSIPMQIIRSARGSLDSEGLFPLEGMDRNVDTDPEEEDIDDIAPVTGVLTRPRNGGPDQDLETPRGLRNIARSLPVTVPGFGRSERDRCHGDTDDDDTDTDRVPRQDPMYIAASIKALARSVYGDTPFGELPRPRFSSQI